MKKPIKILFLAASPDNLTHLALDEEARSITQKIDQSDSRDCIELVTRWAVRAEDLLLELNKIRPSIVQFSGHGSANGCIYLLDDNRKAYEVDKLASLFTTLKDNIRLVILNACYSEKQAKAITNTIDCVLGMSDEISDEAAIVFTAAFYSALGFEKSVGNAFRQGLLAIDLKQFNEEHVPKLLAREGVDPDSIFLLQADDLPSIPSKNTFEFDLDLSEALADSNPNSRRKAIASLTKQYKGIKVKTPKVAMCLAQIYRAAAYDSKTITASAQAWDDSIKAAITAIKTPTSNSSDEERYQLVRLFSEIAVDFSQSGLNSSIEANLLMKTLNLADRELGQYVFQMTNRTPDNNNAEEHAMLLTQRSKINRALAKVKHIRSGRGSPRSQQVAIELNKQNSLRHSEDAIKIFDTQSSHFERALSLFASSKDYQDLHAVEAMEELRGLVNHGFLTPAGYELCRQMNYRHLGIEVVSLFPRVFKADRNRQRAYRNVHDYAWAIKGIHSNLEDGATLPPNLRSCAVQAKLWLEECVSYGYYCAIDKVMLAYMRSMLGVEEKESLAALAGLNPVGGGIINELADLVENRPDGAAEGLLIGLGEPSIWNLIGTYLKTWTLLNELSIKYYEMARCLEPSHPMHSFNKALVLADLNRFGESKIALDECDRKRGSRANWYKANKDSIEALRARLVE